MSTKKKSAEQSQVGSADCKVGRTDGRTDRRTDGQTDRQTDASI